MTITYHAMNSAEVAALRAGGPDAYGAPAERRVAGMGGLPCRSCLTDINPGETLLLLAHRPFDETQPFAETGPIFLCTECEGRAAAEAPPPILDARKEVLVKGYTAKHEIFYGSGQITACADLGAYCEQLFEDEAIAYIHLRSTTNNCYFCRVERA